eukprot:COSAG06_NODE_4342_length_4354_cov_84.610150_2_plen_288_part_00
MCVPLLLTTDPWVCSAYNFLDSLSTRAQEKSVLLPGQAQAEFALEQVSDDKTFEHFVFVSCFETGYLHDLGEKIVFLPRFYCTKMIVLPRQARDRYSEISKKRAPSIYAGNPKVKEVTERAIKQIIDAVRKKHFLARLVLPFWLFVPSLSWQNDRPYAHETKAQDTHAPTKGRGALLLFCGTLFLRRVAPAELPLSAWRRPSTTTQWAVRFIFFSTMFALLLPFPSLSLALALALPLPSLPFPCLALPSLPFPFPFPSLPCGPGSGFGSGSGCGSGCGCGPSGAPAS